MKGDIGPRLGGFSDSLGCWRRLLTEPSRHATAPRENLLWRSENQRCAWDAEDGNGDGCPGPVHQVERISQANNAIQQRNDGLCEYADIEYVSYLV